MIRKLLDKKDIKYKYVEDALENVSMCFTNFESEANRIIPFVFLENKDMKSFSLYIPEIIEFNESDRLKMIELINDENCLMIHGTYFIRSNQNSISYRLSQSLENNSKLTQSQLEDYIDVALFSADNIIDIIGEIDEDF